MNSDLYKKKSEKFFAKAIGQVIRFRLLVIVLTVLFTGLAVSNLRTLAIDTSNEGFFHENDPILLTYNDFREQFGRDDMIAVAIMSDEIFTFDFLEKLLRLHEDLEENVPHLNEITSMINARNTHGDGDILRVDDLLAHFPENEEQLIRLRDLVLKSSLYKNMLISEDGKLTTVILETELYATDGAEDLLEGFDTTSQIDQNQRPQEFLSDEEISRIVKTVQTITAKYDSENFKIYVAGSPVITQNVKQFMMQDMKKFLRFAILTIGICLFIMFRRISGVVLPLMVVALTLIATLGLMAAVGLMFKTPTTILPSFLLAVGVGDSVHILALTYLNLRNGKPKNIAITQAFSHSGLALVMTTLTTAAGLASFSLAKVAPIADLGLFSAIGVMIALLYTLTFLPAALSLLPLKEKVVDAQQDDEKPQMDRFLASTASFSVKNYRQILTVSAILLAIGTGGLLQVKFSHNVLTWLPESLGIRQATEVVNEELRGSVVLELILDSGKENGLYDRDLLVSLDKLSSELQLNYKDTDLFIGKVISLTTMLKEIHQALHENNPQYYKIPDNAKLIPQELLLFENSGSDDLENVIDSQFRIARITFKVPWEDALLYTPFINDVETLFKKEFGGKKLEGGEDIHLTVTGIMSLLASIIHASIYSAAQSYCIAIAVITFMMVLLIGDLKLGLISMIPNLTPIIIVLGCIGWLSIPLNMFTMLVASIAIGLSVDNTIHFMHNFRRYFDNTGDVATAVHNAMDTTGRALLTTTIVLCLGFFIFMFASMTNLFEFGLFTGMAIILALASNFLMAPALLKLVVRKNVI